MGIRTGAQFLAKLDAMRPHLVIDGEVVSENLTRHPAFRQLALTYAKLFDMQHDPAHRDAAGPALQGSTPACTQQQRGRGS